MVDTNLTPRLHFQALPQSSEILGLSKARSCCCISLGRRSLSFAALMLFHIYTIKVWLFSTSFASCLKFTTTFLRSPSPNLQCHPEITRKPEDVQEASYNNMDVSCGVRLVSLKAKSTLHLYFESQDLLTQQLPFSVTDSFFPFSKQTKTPFKCLVNEWIHTCCHGVSGKGFYIQFLLLELWQICALPTLCWKVS